MFVPCHVDGAGGLEYAGRDEAAAAVPADHDVAGVGRVEGGRGRLEEQDVRRPDQLPPHPHVLHAAVLALKINAPQTQGSLFVTLYRSVG